MKIQLKLPASIRAETDLLLYLAQAGGSPQSQAVMGGIIEIILRGIPLEAQQEYFQRYQALHGDAFNFIRTLDAPVYQRDENPIVVSVEVDERIIRLNHCYFDYMLYEVELAMREKTAVDSEKAMHAFHKLCKAVIKAAQRMCFPHCATKIECVAA